MARFALGSLLAVLLACPLAAEDAPKPKGQATAQGKVKAVDAKVGTVTITQRINNKDVDLIVRFAANAKIAVDGKVAKLDDVPVDAHEARVHGGKLEGSQVADAESLWVIGTSEYGYFVKLNGEKLTFRPEKAAVNKLPDKIVTLTPDAKALIGGKEGKFTEFKAGDRVTLRYTADGKTVHIVLKGKESK